MGEQYTQANLFKDIPVVEEGEQIEVWLRCKNVVIERIVSSDKLEPVWYNQKQDEWVLLLQGSARLEIEGHGVTLTAGDTIFIESGKPHRVLETSKKPPCIWLAIHIH